jgi:hypothetical protein
MIFCSLGFGIPATTTKTVWCPVCARGTVKTIQCVFNEETDMDETLTLYRGDNIVAVATPPADATDAGIPFIAVLDPTYGQLVFDPNDSVVANRVMKFTVPDTFDTKGTMRIVIEYDDGAYVSQPASEA